MKRTYIIEHWMMTLLLGPVISQVIESIWGANPHQVVGLFEVYPLTLLFSIVFSLPAFLVYTVCFYFLSRQDINPITAKAILIMISVVGIYVTQKVIKGVMSRHIIIVSIPIVQAV